MAIHHTLCRLVNWAEEDWQAQILKCTSQAEPNWGKSQRMAHLQTVFPEGAAEGSPGEKKRN